MKDRDVAAQPPVAQPPAAEPGATAPSAEYRLDLDGLRGIAIALVVAFHVWYGKVSGGVDIFLVLSGFFFTGMLLRRVERTGRVVPREVAVRTGRRLLPALMVVLAAVAVATVVTKPYSTWSNMSGQTIASALYYQNWYLAGAAESYLAADPSVSPLQHMWSMAVQGQFYVAIVVLLALVAWVCRRVARPAALRPAIVVLSVLLGAGSFVYAAVWMTVSQEWTYYDSAARAWELLTGALLAAALPWLRLGAGWAGRTLAAVLAVTGLGAVLVCGLLFDGARQFPGPAALFPVGAAVALIIAGIRTESGRRPLVSRLLATRPMVELGAIAYSLYLWHWPLLIYYLVQTGKPHAGLYGGLLVIGVSLVLALVTNKFIEEPLRMRSGAAAVVSPAWRRRIPGVAVSLVGVLVFGACVSWQVVVARTPSEPVEALPVNEYPGAEALFAGAEVPVAKLRPSILEASNDLPAPTRDGCISDWFNKEVVTCTYGDPNGSRTIAMVGNSHTEHWMPAMDALARVHDIKVVVYLKMGCSLNIRDDAQYRGLDISDCRDWSRQVIDILAADPPEFVFTTATAPVWPSGGDVVPAEYLDVWAALAERRLNVLAIRDTPWLRSPTGVRYSAVDCLAAGGDSATCGMARTAALAPVNPALVHAAAFPNMKLLDLTDSVCGPDVCRVVEGNVLVYHDEHHLSASYARTLAPELERQIGTATGWW
ncbi:acyltransferase family protein [Nocardia sp. NPDC051750]|uniref:acyltransferase family protein n=1 Tax=Nocardia sp. NPDC051750 TaxID=3364325 RepID=UPI0037880CAD